MKKIYASLIGIITFVFSLTFVNANTITYSDISNGDSIVKDSSNTFGYYSGKYYCNSCIVNEAGSDAFGQVGHNGSYEYDGVGVFYKNGENWYLGSYASRNNSNTRLSSLFTMFKVENGDDTWLNYNSSDNNFSNNNSNVSVVMEPSIYKMEGKKDLGIKLHYTIKNNDTSGSKKITIATFNDLYLGAEPITSSSTICDDNGTYSLVNTNTFPDINSGFVGKTSTSFMNVVLDSPKLLKKTAGTFNYWVGKRSLDPTENEYTNRYSSNGLTGTKEYTDSGWAYSWLADIGAGETVEFETLIGIGNINLDITIDENKIGDNYNKDTKTFDIGTNTEYVHFGGIITDNCGMGTCTYKINGNDEYVGNCEPYTYYTNSNNQVEYTANVPTKWLTDQGENTFEVTANSVACGTKTATTKFNLPKDQESGKKLGINSNYIALGVILLGGVALFIYSRKQNKFPQV